MMEENPQIQVNLMNNISFAYRRISPSRSLEYAERAQYLATKIHDEHGLAIAYKHIGNYHIERNTPIDTTLSYFQKSIDLAHCLSDYYTVASCLNDIGLVKKYAGDFENAIPHFLEGLEMFEEHPFSTEQLGLKYRLLGNLGSLYHLKEDFKKANYYLEACINLSMETGAKATCAAFMDDLARVKVQLGQYRMAEEFFEEALSLQRDLSDYQSEIHTLNAYHELKLRFEEFGAAEDLLLQSLQLAEEKDFPRLTFLAHFYLGSLYLERNDFLQASSFFYTALEMSQRGFGKDLEPTLILKLSKAYEGMGDPTKAYMYLQRWASQADSIKRVEKASIAAEIEAKYFAKQQEHEIEQLEGDKRQAQVMIYSLASFVVILLVLLVSIYYLFRSNKKQSLLLSLRNSELEEVREELNRSNYKLKEYIDSNLQLENFAYMASHDLRSPLVNIIAFSERLLESSEGKLDETENTLLKFMHKNALGMETLINSLLDYSKVNTEKLHPTRNYPQEVIQEVLDDITTDIEKNEAQILLDIAASNPISIDRVKLKQVFQNLLLNAIKFCPTERNPEIRVSFQEEHLFWKFSVADNGIGIDKEYLEQVFLIFRRLHNKDEYKGTGIGLAAVKRLVEQHNGEIWVESTPGKGSTFHFTISKSLEKLAKELKPQFA